MTEITNHDLQHYELEFGKHRGTRIQRVPVGYLNWMVNNNTEASDYAKAELSRRGTCLPDVEVSNHAVDSASLRCFTLYQYDRKNGEGLHKWLMRMTKEAQKKGKVLEDDGEGCIKYGYKDLKLVVQSGNEFPVLKTIMKRTF